MIMFIVSECVYFIYYGSFRYMFPQEQTHAIKQALCGFFTRLKVGIANGFSKIDKKFMKGKSKQNESGSNTKRNNDNEGGNDNERNANDNNNNDNNNKDNEIHDVAINN